MPSGAMPALAIAGGGQLGGGTGAATAMELPQPYGPFATAGGMMAKQHGEGGAPEPLNAAAKEKARTELESINEQLKNPDLSGKQKKALRTKRKELRELLGLSSEDVEALELSAPERYKKRASGLSGKEAATDVPSWIESWPDARPGLHENGEAFATRMMNRRYGLGGWERTGIQKSEFSKLHKFADRAFE
jgi:Spy/CpxP family protein refolding chaperone